MDNNSENNSVDKIRVCPGVIGRYPELEQILYQIVKEEGLVSEVRGKSVDFFKVVCLANCNVGCGVAINCSPYNAFSDSNKLNSAKEGRVSKDAELDEGMLKLLNFINTYDSKSYVQDFFAKYPTIKKSF